MSYSVSRENLLHIPAEAYVLSLEITMDVTERPAGEQLLQQAGEKLRQYLPGRRYIPVGSAALVEAGRLMDQAVILVTPPRWLTGKSNELLALRRCYESIYAAAKEAALKRIACPFLSAGSYRFPVEEALHIAFSEAEKSGIETVFAADLPGLYEQSQIPYHKPRILSYVGYYRDYAVFELENGQYARVDLRPERCEVGLIPYIEACYRKGNNPLQPDLPEEEIARLREIYEKNDW